MDLRVSIGNLDMGGTGKRIQEHMIAVGDEIYSKIHMKRLWMLSECMTTEFSKLCKI